MTVPEWNDMTVGQKRLAAEREHGEYFTASFGVLLGIPIGFLLVWMTDGDWAKLNGFVWISGIFALLGHLKSRSKATTAHKYRLWLADYEIEMRQTGRQDRGEPYDGF